MLQDKKSRAIEAFQRGCTWEETANAVGVSRMSLWRWAAADSEFKKAIDDAKADPDAEVEAVTFQNACDPDPANNVLRMFWLKSRKGYCDRLDVTSGDRPLRYVDRAHNPRDQALAHANGTNGHTNGNGLAP